MWRQVARSTFWGSVDNPTASEMGPLIDQRPASPLVGIRVVHATRVCLTALGTHLNFLCCRMSSSFWVVLVRVAHEVLGEPQNDSRFE